jgi:hypothetical protein
VNPVQESIIRPNSVARLFARQNWTELLTPGQNSRVLLLHCVRCRSRVGVTALPGEKKTGFQSRTQAVGYVYIPTASKYSVRKIAHDSIINLPGTVASIRRIISQGTKSRLCELFTASVHLCAGTGSVQSWLQSCKNTLYTTKKGIPRLVYGTLRYISRGIFSCASAS